MSWIRTCCGLCGDREDGSLEEQQGLLRERPPNHQSMEDHHHLGLSNANLRKSSSVPLKSGRQRQGAPGVDYTPQIAYAAPYDSSKKLEELDLPQCSVFFSKKYWSPRYPQEYFNSEITSIVDETGTFRLRALNKCVDAAWTVDRSLSELQECLEQLQRSYGDVPSFPNLRSSKLGTREAKEILPTMQEAFFDLVSRPDICRQTPLRQFLQLDKTLHLKQNVLDRDNLEKIDNDSDSSFVQEASEVDDDEEEVDEDEVESF